MQNDILFDNIYIGHSIEEAEKIKAATFDIKLPIEKAEEDATAPPPPPEDEKPSFGGEFLEDPISYIKQKIDLFVTLAQHDPIQAAKFVPEVAGGLLAFALGVIVLLVSIVTASTTPAVKEKVKETGKKAKETVSDAADKVAEAASTGAESVQQQATKRSKKAG
jgi:calnexin